MTDKAREAIKELEEIRLELFRCAANLDDIIDNVKLVIDDPQGAEFVKMYVVSFVRHREDLVKHNLWNELQKSENEAWSKLLDNLS